MLLTQAVSQCATLGMAGSPGRDGTYKVTSSSTSGHYFETHEDILIVIISSISVVLVFLNDA